MSRTHCEFGVYLLPGDPPNLLGYPSRTPTPPPPPIFFSHCVLKLERTQTGIGRQSVLRVNPASVASPFPLLHPQKERVLSREFSTWNVIRIKSIGEIIVHVTINPLIIRSIVHVLGRAAESAVRGKDEDNGTSRGHGKTEGR